ncbi:homoserine O-acetyltransferase [Rhinocladiella mackenziei CBS 650.93]|uniref:Rhinocladiella mackenziei CBS 650.93 unplaced genomic scaffold supercont1.1, whole genome shotgun sequence n=1 Tax=Rhinocladiella mackenziei CBS 650.93 TaxID=1442369 RepID=A0A0D2ITY8_9EURO|nr:homoserine O-acetyltransferase [Rhinocladiella mackenziei CBS 650.93]KIX09529.1 homoserine O-acetyltransferase [Rhinocladiella mackenziei CBS 650.93]
MASTHTNGESNALSQRLRQCPPVSHTHSPSLPAPHSLLPQSYRERLLNPVESAKGQPENPYAKLVSEQQIVIVPSFTLESGVVLHNVPIAYTTRGQLSENKDNALVICHALSGSADVADWWGPLMGGPGQAFDVTRFFVVCLNSLGSPYGSASPVTNKDGDPGLGRYGPEFPLTTIRDDVNIHKIVLDDLGVRQIACVVGGSMGGMLCLEYAYFGKDYVRSIAPIATSATHSAWGISWGEAQRQAIYSDPKYEDGYYPFDDPPTAGLGAARMSALLTYRSRDSFEARFGRSTPDLSQKASTNRARESPNGVHNEHWTIHNDGHKRARGSRDSRPASSNGMISEKPTPSESPSTATFTDPQFNGTTEFSIPIPVITGPTSTPTRHYFSAQSYLRYQGTKFVTRFDANCYIAITRKLDTHDVSRNRAATVKEALSQIEQPTLVLGIESDGLFTIAEQEELAENIPNGRLGKIDSPEGHDAFLLQFEQVNSYLLAFFREFLPDIMNAPGTGGLEGQDGEIQDGVGIMTKSSTFGEAEVGDLTAW